MEGEEKKEPEVLIDRVVTQFDENGEPLETIVHTNSIFDRSNPHSVISRLWSEAADIFERHYHGHPKLFRMTERELMRQFSFDYMMCVLRLRFWHEYYQASDRDRGMKLKEVCGGVCAPDVWKDYIKSASRVAWILCQPVRYEAALNQAHYRSMMNINEILEQPIRDEKGKLDHKLIGHLITIHKMLDDRKHGAAVQRVAIQQRIDQRVHSSSGPNLGNLLTAETTADQVAEIDKQLREVNRKLLTVGIAPEVKEEQEPRAIEVEDKRIEGHGELMDEPTATI